MIAKLEIIPSFIPACSFKVEKTATTAYLTFHKDAVLFSSKKMQKCVEINPQVVNEVWEMAEKAMHTYKPETRLLLDGVRLKSIIEKDNKREEFSFSSPENDSDALKLVMLYLDLSQKYIQQPDFTAYIELLEGYFYSKLPIKEFDEQPYRVRIYSSLTIHEKQALTEVFNRLSQKEELVIDMTNFIGMGTALYACFAPLFAVKKLRFIANENALNQLSEMGFRENVILLLE